MPECFEENRSIRGNAFFVHRGEEHFPGNFPGLFVGNISAWLTNSRNVLFRTLRRSSVEVMLVIMRYSRVKPTSICICIYMYVYTVGALSNRVKGNNAKASVRTYTRTRKYTIEHVQQLSTHTNLWRKKKKKKKRPPISRNRVSYKYRDSSRSW